jgi:hypothetical protein
MHRLRERHEVRVSPAHVLRHTSAGINQGRNASGMQRLQDGGDCPVAQVHVKDGNLDSDALLQKSPYFLQRREGANNISLRLFDDLAEVLSHNGIILDNQHPQSTEHIFDSSKSHVNVTSE